jgi:hypothetical protein
LAYRLEVQTRAAHALHFPLWVWGNGSYIFNQWGSHGSPSNLSPCMHSICTSLSIETRMYDLAAKTAIELLRGLLGDVPGSRYTAIEPSSLMLMAAH